MDLPNNVKGFELINPDKVERALIGNVTRSGALVGGVQKSDGSFDDDALLAEYDRLGGLVRKGEDKVKTGSFYDFKAKQPRVKAEVVLEYRINGRVVEVADGEAEPMIVKASKVSKQLEAEEVADKASKKASKKK